MCGRFALIADKDDIEALFALLELEDFPPRYNIAPTQPILLIIAGPRRNPGSNLPDRRAMLVRWGLIPGWAKNPAELQPLFNARADTAAGKASFKAAMRHRRSLIPASGFYEWRRNGSNRPQPYWVRPRHGRPIAFAGLMETWAEPGGSEIDTGAILTTSANATISHIHDRMPVVIDPAGFCALARLCEQRTARRRRPPEAGRPRFLRGDPDIGQGQQGGQYRTGPARRR